MTVGEKEFAGGFQTQELKEALNDLANISGREWFGGDILLAKWRHPPSSRSA